MILDPRPDLDQYQNLTISRWSPLAHSYHVWSTSVNAYVSYPAHSDRQTDRQTDKANERRTDSNDRITQPQLVE